MPATLAGAAFVGAAGAVAMGPKWLAALGGALIAVFLVRHRMALLTAFLYIGIAKDLGPLARLPADPTLLLAILLAAVCFFRLLGGKVWAPPLPFIAVLLTIGFLLAVGVLRTPDIAYGDQKTARFWILTLLAALSPFFLIEDRRDLRRLAGWIALAGCFAAVGALVHPPAEGTGEQGRLVLDSLSGTIFLSRLLCAAAFILLLASAFYPARGARLLMASGALGILIVALGVGSRGPILALALTLVCIIIILIVGEPRRLLWLVLAVAVAIAIFPFVSLPETSVARFQGVIANPSGALSQDARSAIYSQAIDLIKEHPLAGIGTGGYAIYSSVVSRSGFNEQYPHNIFLELWVELGVFAPVVLAAAILYVTVGLLRRLSTYAHDDGRHLVELYLGLLLFNLFAVQFSGDINDNRTFWWALGTGWFFTYYGLPREGGVDAVGATAPNVRISAAI